MKNCKNCGFELAEDAIFCDRCGVPVEDDSEPVCRNCGLKPKKEDKFCTKCGSKLPHSAGAKEAVEEEKELLNINANLYRGAEAVGGKLLITNKRLIFNSHKFNFQRGATIIPIREISEVTKKNFFGIITNGMCIKTVLGENYEFVVNNRAKVIELINNLKNAK